MNKRGVAATILSFLVLLLGVIPAGAEESPSSSSTSATAEAKAPARESVKAESKDKAPVKESAKPEAKAESKDKAPVKESVEAKAPVRETKSSDCPPKRPTPTPTVSKTATPTTSPPTSPQPPAEVGYSDWYDVSWDCEVQLVTRTRTRAETPYVWNGSSWVLDRANTRYTEEIGTRPMTSSELLDCGPPLPPSPEPTPTPTPTPTPDPSPEPTPTPTPTATPSLNSARPGLPKTGN